MAVNIVEMMDAEGCAGCAEDFLIAEANGDHREMAAVLRRSADHIRTEGYSDAFARGTSDLLESFARVIEAESGDVRIS